MRVGLYEIEELKPLEKVAKKYDVEFVLFGSTVRRYLKGLISKEYLKSGASLFDLVPLLSDIDMSHTGPDRYTRRIFQEILADVPYADMFRWQFVSQERRQLYAKANRYNLIIPATRIELSSRSGFIDPLNGIFDLVDDRYTCGRNKEYHRSPLWRKKRDLEFFGAILYLKLLVETNPTIQFFDQPGWKTIKEVFAESHSDAIMTRIKEFPDLRMRLRYLLKSLWAAGPMSLTEKIVSESGLKELLEKIDSFLGVAQGDGFYSEIQDTMGGCRISSAHIKADKFRLNHRVQGWGGGATANIVFANIANNSNFSYLNSNGARRTGIDYSSERLLNVSPRMTLNEGVSTSSYEGFGSSKIVPNDGAHLKERGEDAGNPGSVKIMVDRLSRILSVFFVNLMDPVLAVVGLETKKGAGVPNEFVHFIFQYPSDAVTNDCHNLGLVLVLLCKGSSYVFALPSFCELLPQGEDSSKRIGIRVNCGGILERIGQITDEGVSSVDAVVFLTEREKIATRLTWH